MDHDEDEVERAGGAPGVLRGWWNEVVAVPVLTVLGFVPVAVVVILAGRFLHPALGPTEPLGAAVLVVAFLGAYAFAVFRVRGAHARIHPRYP